MLFKILKTILKIFNEMDVTCCNTSKCFPALILVELLMRGKCLYSQIIIFMQYPPCSSLEHFVEGAFLMLFVFAIFVLNFISFLIRKLFCSAVAK